VRADSRPTTRPAHNPSSPATALIVGASLAGLMTALTLSRTGVHVTLLERSDDTGRTGAALHVQDGLLERITGLPTSQVPQPLAPGIQTWFAVHGALRVGDAAHVPTPMTGSGFAESLYDAEAIANAISDSGTTTNALLNYESARIRSARNLVQSGQGFSRSFARRAA
jgi:2-polyprenyl-6-methoxyphenol hydroxylase-like FAD-dependent oxidoreductase